MNHIKVELDFIPGHESLPDSKYGLLVLHRDGDIEEAVYESGSWWEPDQEAGGPMLDVTHWAKIPEIKDSGDPCAS